MPLKQTINSLKNIVLPGILNSYSIIFFSNNKVLAVALMATSFFNFYAGLSGLLAVVITLLIGSSMNFDKTTLRNGGYSFNALLTGIGMGTFFDPSFVFYSLLAIASLLTLILSVTMGGWLYKYKLPFLSIPFVITFWFVVLPSSHFDNLGLTQRNIYWINEMYAMGGNSLLSFFQTVDSLSINKLVDIYLRSLSSILFQSNLIAGILIAVALLISSRITFSLSIIGFLTAYLFAQFSGSEAASITYYNIGANYMMVAFAIGGYFMIPSKQSYLWAILLIPLTSLVLLFFSKLLGFIQMPVFSLPFSFVVILFVYFLGLRSKASKLIVTPLQFLSPEKNLYTYQNNSDRLAHFLYFPLHLPFWGEWTVTQAHDGEFTHLGDWGKAFDFMILDNENKTYRGNGLVCENYNCYNKPVLAPADGVVEEIVDGIEDNEIGKVNTVNNWGNSIIIRHTTGLYTQISHLRKGTFKVLKGEFVKQGDVLANCGNSGRSPQPHIHFQVQTVQNIGSKTLYYPFAYFFEKNENNKSELRKFTIPQEGNRVSAVSPNTLLQKAFEIMPFTTFEMKYKNEKGDQITENWEANTDAYNYKYLYCKETDSTAYYVNDGFMFYFTAFYGDKNSLLYYFYLSAYKVFLGDNAPDELSDSIPLNLIRNRKISSWLHDFVAPFFSYMHVRYNLKIITTNNSFETGFLELKSSVNVTTFGKSENNCAGLISINKNGIFEFQYKSGKTKILATCIKS